MNERQRRFADEYIISGNIYQSAIKAGYSDAYAKTQASKIIENHSVKSYIDKRLAELEKHKIAKADEVLQVFTSILRQELTEEVTELNQITGEFVTIEKKPSIAEVIKAGSELMKRYPTKLELQKLKLEIEKLQSQVGGSEGQDEKIAGFLEKVKELVVDDS
ncbi:Phage Terminase Small Subunit [Streptococcus infantarius subsp. infantarius]|uniref:terminase small subunit n=1 Tax=Streptococcus gallolyticus TaxID=315405 RepID=UPI00201AE93D|nr:terminase small subunit [Streptococcus gallolyticus]MCL4890662.1 terminase small subunit [Streptococcus gallolyticus]MCO4638348.1 Phage Terminase Small Subunit [Streptococcus infantarius subsp. infantarius]MCO4641666.1 Phage Terminase Small Subunit [Streptococcus infantarius subsp. infantarius]MCO4643443.1 Phage Terminase Small Subunit [Streptococcus infantarius subsp. infantarius]